MKPPADLEDLDSSDLERLLATASRPEKDRRLTEFQPAIVHVIRGLLVAGAVASWRPASSDPAVCLRDE